MSRVYRQIYDGDWYYPTKTSHKDMCCDCGLVHTVDYRVEKGSRLAVRVQRDSRATANARRKFKFKGPKRERDD